ncbi:MAG TPA: SRPBCC family protein [Candidatus Limnocylindria bacterium]
MEINRDAPVTAIGAVDVSAAPEDTWEVLADLARWPRWNADITEVSVDGPLAAGTSFRWKSGPGWITSVLREVDPPRTLGWTGTTFSIRAVHVYRLEPIDAGTRVRTEESWEGLLASLLRRIFRGTLRTAVDTGLERLKAEVESRAAAQRQAEAP